MISFFEGHFFSSCCVSSLNAFEPIDSRECSRNNAGALY